VRRILTGVEVKLEELKGKAVRGGFVKLCGQGITSILRLGFVVVMARLLNPEDFGLVAMVTIVTGIYELFITAGLSAATVQKDEINDKEVSTLFWINILVGIILALLCVLTAPILVEFYSEPRLRLVTVALAAGFILSSAGVQHFALLQRELRYGALTAIEILAQLASIAVGIGLAVAGLGYWALVAAAVTLPAVATVLVWATTAWIPGKPGRISGIQSMLRFGATITVNNLVVHLAYNFDKLLIGRYWGPDALGLYGRAYQLINIPNTSLLSAIGGVAFSALSRLQSDPVRCRAYFLKGYSLVNSLTLPTTMFCAAFAYEIILVVLGPKWVDAAPLFRLLAPTIMVFGIINPTGWLLQSNGFHGRSLKIALVIAPLVTVACVIGLPYGATGVAFAFSAAMTLWVVPHVLWCVRGTVLSPLDLFAAIWKPFLASILAAAVAFEAVSYLGPSLTPIFRLLAGGCVMGGVYFGILLFAMRQKGFYFGLVATLRRASLGPRMDTRASLGGSVE
jgi:O-antigen/teichoic acid export membrane protein